LVFNAHGKYALRSEPCHSLQESLLKLLAEDEKKIILTEAVGEVGEILQCDSSHFRWTANEMKWMVGFVFAKDKNRATTHTRE
jgi:hypothetical protein